MPTEKNTLSIYSFRANSRKNRTELLKNADFYLRFSIAFDDDRTLKSCPEIALKIAPGKKLSEESSTFL